MTDKTTEALKLAEEALETAPIEYDFHGEPVDKEFAVLSNKALAAIREALAQPVKQEPAAIISESAIGLVKLHANGVSLPFGTPLYAAPVSAKMQGDCTLAEPVKQEPVLAKHQPCGCIVCTCEDEVQCQGCGGWHCGTHPIGEFPNPLYAAPVSAKREWVDLTPIELAEAFSDKGSADAGIRAVIAAFKEKNK